MIAKIAVDAATFAIDKPYSYRVPQNMRLVPGVRVTVPFGKGNRRTEGIVLAVEPGDGADLKTVERCLDETPVLNDTMLRLAAFLRNRCFCSFYDALRAMLPAGLWFRAKSTYRLTEDRSWKDAPCRKDGALEILNLLEDLGGAAEESALLDRIAEEDRLHDILRYLVRKKWVADETDYLRRLGDKTEKIATLASSAEEAMEYARRCHRAPMQRSVLETLCAVGSVSVKELCYYTGATTATVKRLETLGYVELTEKQVLRCREIRPAQLESPLELNEEQEKAYQGLRRPMAQEVPGSTLLYGITGSGKTAVYLKLIQACLDAGKAAMLLVPEIALTPQLLSLLAAYFGNAVAVLHSSLSAGERYDQWKRVKDGVAKVVVGTRSAVFAPLRRAGIDHPG